MAFDAHKNLGISAVATAPTPATSGTSLVVSGGEGVRFPAVPFSATVWATGQMPTPANAEVVRVTARTTDTLTIVRAQEGTTARAIVATDIIAATITAKSLTDIESGTNFPLLTTPGPLTFPAGGVIQTGTADGADSGYLQLGSGGAIDASRGAYLSLFGNELGGAGGAVDLTAGNGSLSVIDFKTGGVGAARGRIHPSGGFSWGSTTDPGPANLRVEGSISIGSTFVGPGTNDGADTKQITLLGGGAWAADRGACVTVYGNEHGAAGTLQIMAGNTATGNIDFFTGAWANRGRIHASGGFSWGGTTDPGAGVFGVGAGGFTPGNSFLHLQAPTLSIGTATAGASTVANFINPNGIVGSISTNASATAYNTTSDARLKTPLNRHTNVDVLRDTLIHNFTWKADGSAGRGVFAQEAVSVLPAAVSVGGDERDSGGNLTRPWGVDYSKYVPDLITGWQAHEAELAAVRAEVAALQTARYGTSSPPEGLRMTLWQRVRASVAVWFPAWVTP